MKRLKTVTIVTLLLLAFSGCNFAYDGDEKPDEAPEAAAAFKTAYAGILAKTPSTVAVSDEAALDAALAAYNELGDTAKALIAGEKTLLDTLKSAIDALKPGGLVTIYMAGDSTMADWTSYLGSRPVDRYGWGQFFQRYFDEDAAEVRDLAQSGRSSKDFITLSNYTQIVDNIGPGDYLFVSFGHNDEKDSSLAADPQASKDTNGTYKWYLYQKYILLAREKGATPVLLSPVCRRSQNSGGKPPVNDGTGQDHGFFDDACRELAEETGVAFIDLEQLSGALFDMLVAEGGANATISLMSMTSATAVDNTHFTAKGAWEICNLVAEDIKRQNLMRELLIKTIPIDTLSASPSSLNLALDEEKTLKLIIEPRFAAFDPDSVTWNSSAPGTASVTGNGLTARAKGIATGSAVFTAQLNAADGPRTVNVNVSVYDPASIAYTLAVHNQKTSPASGTTPNNDNLLSWPGTAWSGSNTITSAETTVGLSSTPSNMTVVYVTQPATGAFTWKAKLKMNGGESSASRGLIFGALSSPQESSFKAIGNRYLANGVMREVYHNTNGNFPSGTNREGNVLDTEYIFEIARNDSGAYTGKVTDPDGNVKVPQWTVNTGSVHADLSGAVYPAFYLGGVSVTILELSFDK